MTKSEYQQLVEFLAPRFDDIRDRLGAVENRLDGVENRLTRVEVGVEENRHHIQLVAEGVTTVSQRLDRFQQEVREEFKAVRQEMAAGFSWVKDRFELQNAAIRDLGTRMDQWEAR